MSFIAISSLLIQVGKPIIKTLWDLTQGNFDDHETRIASVEAGATKIEAWNSLAKTRGSAASLTGFDIYRAPANIQLIEARVSIFAVGSVTGVLEFDIQKSAAKNLDFSTGAVSVFTTKPSVDFGTATDFDQSTNAVFDINEQDILKDERLRLDITQLPATLTKFEIFLLAELN